MAGGKILNKIFYRKSPLFLFSGKLRKGMIMWT